MGTNFPTSLDNTTNLPTAADLADDNLDTKPHSTLHGDLGLAVLALEAKVGIDGSAVTSSHDYKFAQLATTYQPLDSDLTAIAALTTTSFGRGLLALADAAALRSSAGLDDDLATFSVPASTTITAAAATVLDDASTSAMLTTLGAQPVDSDLTAIAALTTTSYGRAFLELANAAAALSALGLDADLATFSVPASTTISTFGATLVDDANAAAAIATLGLDADIATLSLPASTTITAAAATVLDDASTSAMLTTLGAQPLDSDLTTIAGLTATTDNIIQSVGSAWASRTPTQVKAALAITTADVSTLDTSLGALNTQAQLQAARAAAQVAADGGYFVAAGLRYFPSGTAGKLDRDEGTVVTNVSGVLAEANGAAATAIGSTVATLGAALTAGQAMWVNVELDSSGASQFNSGTAAVAASAAIPDTTTGRTIAGWIYIPYSAVALNAIDTLPTTANDKAKFIDARVIRPGQAALGWKYDTNPWVYVSASSFKVAGINVTNQFPVGTRVRCTNNSTTFYGTVIAAAFSTDTTVTLVANDDYALANSAIQFPAYSLAPKPIGYPVWFNYTPTYTGFTATVPSGGSSKFSVIGNTCWLNVIPSTNGTSNATTFTLTAPIDIAVASQATCRAFDNGAVLTTPALASISPTGAKVITMFSNMGAGAWTNANGKRASIVTQYQI